MKNLSECSWKLHGGDDVQLTSDLQYENNDYIIRVYAGFVSDGGSLPRISWTLLGIFPFSPECVLAFFLHDFLYSSQLLTRSQSDNLMREVLGIPPSCSKFQQWLMWIHVRIYGWFAWHSKHPEDIHKARNFGEIIHRRHLMRSVVK